jgi:hypothetical protein
VGIDNKKCNLPVASLDLIGFWPSNRRELERELERKVASFQSDDDEVEKGEGGG